ncbi:MAG: GNAT family N-acetyltransferase [Chloroflexi bacterium]|nr:GNAT family N-acetyltransferase [Chloroflexota bacterium]
MPDKFTIRVAKIADAAALTRLNILFNGSSDPAEVMAQRLADPRQVEIALVAESAGQVIGFAGLRRIPSLFYAETFAELTELFVEERYRRQGIGQALITVAEQLAIQGGSRELMVLTGKDNQEAQSLYRSQGYGNMTMRIWPCTRTF